MTEQYNPEKHKPLMEADLEAYDQLPLKLRQFLKTCFTTYNSVVLLKACQQFPVDAVIAHVRAADQAALAKAQSETRNK